MALTYQRETLAGLWDELAPLLDAHHAEVGDPSFTVAPDRTAYATLESAGNTVLVTARADATLVGYVLFFIHPSLHHPAVLCAVSDAVYLAPKHRGIASYRLLRAALNELVAYARATWGPGYRVAIDVAETPRRPFGRLLAWIGLSPAETHHRVVVPCG